MTATGSKRAMGASADRSKSKKRVKLGIVEKGTANVIMVIMNVVKILDVSLLTILHPGQSNVNT